MKLRVIVVDDEPMARRRLKRFLGNDPEVEVLAECPDGAAAVAAIERLRPDIVFLDVQMPNLSGFDVLPAISPEHIPVIIFVTAFDRYALEAFEAQALDYLLKPFGEPRVHKALERARTFLEGRARKGFQEQLARLVSATAETRAGSCILVPTSERVVVLRPKEIDWVQADGDYVQLHVGRESYLLRSTLGDVEQRLKGGSFIRIHRSRLVNLDRVKEFRPLFRGESVVVLMNGERLTASQSCLKNLKQQLQAPLITDN